MLIILVLEGAQWLSDRVLDLRSRGCRFELTKVTALCPCVRHINPCLVLVQPSSTYSDITEKTVDWDVKNQIKVLVLVRLHACTHRLTEAYAGCLHACV